MSRPSLRRTPNLEGLESRLVLSAVVAPTADQQYALELINLARTNPSLAATEITSNLSPAVRATLGQYGLSVSGLVSEMDSATAQPPLAWNSSLASSAQRQSQYEANNGVQTHQGAGEAGLESRINSAGYANDLTYGENTYAYATSIEEAMQSFLFDWGVSDHGHYNDLLQPGTSAENSFKDVGIGLVSSNNGNGVGPLVITQDFGSQQGEGPQIVGVVYNDPNQLGYYTQGSGLGGVTIDFKNLSTGQDTQTQTWNAGGYQMPVTGNTAYQVTAIQGGQVISSQRIQVGDVNVEADFVNNPATYQAVQAVQAAPAPMPAPTPAPMPVPTPTPSPTPTPTPTTSPVQDTPTVSQAVAEPQWIAQVAPQAPTQPANSGNDSSSLNLSGWANWTV